MQTAVINLRTEPKIKKQAQEVAHELGFSLGSLLDGYLRDLIRNREVHFTLEERPNVYLKSVMKQAKENYKKGKTSPTFKNIKDELEWLEKQGI